MIDFTNQVVIVTGAGRGLGRLYAIEVARRGGSVVVNDLGVAMHGDGPDSCVADRVVAEIERAGGVAVASHESVAAVAGGLAAHAQRPPPTTDDIAAHLSEISATEAFSVTASIFDEVADVCTRLGIL